MNAEAPAQTGQPALPFTDTYRTQHDQLDLFDALTD